VTGIGMIAKFCDHFRKHKSQARDIVFQVRIEGGKLVALELAQISNTGAGTVIEFRQKLV
jgi:hypothetical protein